MNVGVKTTVMSCNTEKRNLLYLSWNSWSSRCL